MSYREISRLGHPLANDKGQVTVHRVVLYDRIGPGAHPCHWCQRPVTWGRGVADGVLVTDHVDGDEQNNDPRNLVPSCHRCNIRRGMKNLISPDELFIVRPNGSRSRAVRRTCEGCGITFTVGIAETGRGQGRFCTRRCANKTRRERARA